ncbi:MAG: hypothetical protein VB089_16080 [Anaerolineaceae bacterium]|nr:hypothetical protein [Anaerolineaceae bacterium]
MYSSEVVQKIENEMKRADMARAQGNEGLARVCARRAAGTAIRAYLAARQIDHPATNAFELILFLRDMPGIPPELRSIAGSLSTRVTEEFTLPLEADLLAETRVLITTLESLDLPGQSG